MLQYLQINEKKYHVFYSHADIRQYKHIDLSAGRTKKENRSQNGRPKMPENAFIRVYFLNQC